MTGDCQWVLETNVLCGAPEAWHDGHDLNDIAPIHYYHPYVPPASRVEADAREAAIGRDVALIAAWEALFEPRAMESTIRNWVRARHDAGEVTG